MHIISIESDARYAYDEQRRRFVEVCPECGRERNVPATRCFCGHSYDRARRSFFAREWAPAAIAVEFPDRCPHCLRPAERTRRLWRGQLTSLRGTAPGLPPAATNIALDVPVCRRVWPPLLLAGLELVAVFLFVAILLAAVFETLALTAATAVGAGAALLALGAAALWLRRARTWLRFARFDHRSFRLKARRRAYALDLARRNGGRVLEGWSGRH